MYGIRRGFVGLVAAAVAGALVWVASQLNPLTTGGYWSTVGILSGAGLTFGLLMLYGRVADRRLPRLLPGVLVIGVLPALVAAGWVVLAAQPHGNWFRDHVLRWSSDVDIGDLVGDLKPLVFVLALGLGLLVGLCIDRSAPLGSDVATTELKSEQQDSESAETLESLPVDPARVS